MKFTLTPRVFSHKRQSSTSSSTSDIVGFASAHPVHPLQEKEIGTVVRPRPIDLSQPRPIPEYFAEELQDVHIEYTYDNGWKYESWFKNHERIIYSIQGGPMAGRKNYQTAYYQRIREHMWQISWVEETGTTVTITLDIPFRRLTTFISFSAGHWNYPEKAHGYKRNDLDQWRQLATIGNQATGRVPLPEQATIQKIYKGRGSMEDIDMAWPTF